MLEVGELGDYLARGTLLEEMGNNLSPLLLEGKWDSEDVQEMLHSPSQAKETFRRISSDDDSNQGSTSSAHAASLMPLSCSSDSSDTLSQLDDTLACRHAKRARVEWGDEAAGALRTVTSSFPLDHRVTSAAPAHAAIRAAAAPALGVAAARAGQQVRPRRITRAPPPAILTSAAPPLPCPPIGSDGVALGMPWVPVPPVPLTEGPHALSTAAVFAKTSALMASAPAAPPLDVSLILRDVLSGRLHSLPIGLTLDHNAIARDMTSRCLRGTIMLADNARNAAP